MNSLQASAYILLTVWLVLLVAALGFREAGLLYSAGAMLALFCLFPVYVAMFCFFRVPVNKMLDVFFLGSKYLETYVSDTVAAHKDESGRTMAQLGGKRGWLGGSFIVLAWPLYSVIRMPTTVLKIEFDLTDVFTKDDIPVRMSINMVKQFSPDHSMLWGTVNAFDKEMDLTRKTTIDVWPNGETPSGQQLEAAKAEGKPLRPLRSYDNPLLTKAMVVEFSPVVQEAARTVASEYPWTETAGTGTKTIKEFVPDIEEKIKKRLSVYESPLAKAGLFKTLTRDPGTGDILGKPEVGPTLVSIDINVLDIDIPADIKADLGKPYRGTLEGQRLKKIHEESGIPASMVRGLEALEQAETFNLLAAGERIPDIVRGMFGKRGGKPKGKKGSKKP